MATFICRLPERSVRLGTENIGCELFRERATHSPFVLKVPASEENLRACSSGNACLTDTTGRTCQQGCSVGCVLYTLHARYSNNRLFIGNVGWVSIRNSSSPTVADNKIRILCADDRGALQKLCTSHRWFSAGGSTVLHGPCTGLLFACRHPSHIQALIALSTICCPNATWRRILSILATLLKPD